MTAFSTSVTQLLDIIDRLYLETNKIIYPISHFEAVEIVFLQHKI